MPGTLEQLFGVRHLTGLVRTFFDDSRDKFFTDLFKKGKQMMPESEFAEWDEVQAHRHLAPFTGHDNPFPRTRELDRINRYSSMAHIKLYKEIPGRRLFMDRMPGELKPNARAWVMEELKDLQMQVQKSIEYLCVNALLGSIVVNSTTVPGSEIDFTLTFPVNTQNREANWNAPGTAIVSRELELMTAEYTHDSGRLPAQLILNDVTQQYVRANDEVKTYVKDLYQADFLSQGHVDMKLFDSMNLSGLKWWKSVGGYVPEGGSFTRYMPDDRIIVLPANGELNDVLGFAEGTGIVPRKLWGGEGEVGIAQAPSRGMYAYSEAISNPASIRLYVGWIGLPVIRSPLGVTVFTPVV